MRKIILVLSLLVSLSLLMPACGAAQPAADESILIGGALSSYRDPSALGRTRTKRR